MSALAMRSVRASRLIWMYDTYSGMRAPTQADQDVHGVAAATLMAQFSDADGWCYASEEDVREAMRAGGIEDTAYRIVKGDVRETLLQEIPEQISVLRLDTDWYESTRLELELLYPRLSPGGVLIIDDYGYWAGSRKATDEYFATLARPPMLNRVNDQVRLCIKV